MHLYEAKKVPTAIMLQAPSIFLRCLVAHYSFSVFQEVYS